MKATFLLIFLFLFLQANDERDCIVCHKEQHKAWSGSDHDLAMQKATGKTVLGDFDNATFVYNGVTTTFYKKGAAFMVRTDGPDGKLHDYEVSHTFGVRPLQQYLVPFADGRYQVLDIAWDARSKKEGGQRWYHLHPHENVKAGDVLHWSGPNLNWNYMCADCHSTNLKKNYNSETKQYHTRYDAINVSCAACHGDGSRHLKWARNKRGEDPGFTVGTASTNKWIKGENGKPKLLGQIDRREVQLCARCHSRRAQLDDDFAPDKTFEDHHLLATLDEDLYFPDGQIKGEVYVYGSFVQSKMYAAGVTCTDCHDPHTLKRKAEGDKVCLRCHTDTAYAVTEHHHHKPGSSGASCIACHMPSRVYMGVDTRYDHSFRIPRSDVSDKLGTPDACTACHKDKKSAWAAASIKKWYGSTPVGHQDFAYALDALHKNSDTAQQLLYDVLMKETPPIAKASVVEHLGMYPSKQTYTTTLQMLRSKEAMVRLSALMTLEHFPLEYRMQPTFKMLNDPVKSVRVEAARQLSGVPRGDLDPASMQVLDKGIAEYKQTLIFNGDRAESQTALGTLYSNLGDQAKAQEAFTEAIRLQNKFLPAYINFADYYRAYGDDERSKAVLMQGLKLLPEEAQLHYALGLWYIRNKESANGLASLKTAARLAPDNAQLQYAYAVALSDKDVKEAITVLERSLKRHSGDVQTLYGLAFYCQKNGDKQKAKQYEERAKALVNFLPKY